MPILVLGYNLRHLASLKALDIYHTINSVLKISFKELSWMGFSGGQNNKTYALQDIMSLCQG